MNMVLQFLAIVLPAAPQLAELYRAAFLRIGGDPADFDRILAENNIDIEKLAHPDQFRHKPAGDAPQPPHSGNFPYSEVLFAAPDKGRLVAGDEIYHDAAASQWIVWGRVGPRPVGGTFALIETIT